MVDNLYEMPNWSELEKIQENLPTLYEAAARSDAEFVKRLMEMGLTPGTVIEMVKSAPFKGPTEILVRGSRLALGRGMSDKIFVETKNEE